MANTTPRATFTRMDQCTKQDWDIIIPALSVADLSE